MSRAGPAGSSPLIAVVGNAGVGKTTLVRALLTVGGGAHTGLEDLSLRPFQAQFSGDLGRFALANQVDFLVFRAEQEIRLRREQGPGIVDGGLEEDFHVFTRFFHRRGYLTTAEYELCGRLYALLRSLVPAPDLYLHLQAPLAVVRERFAGRSRDLEIARLEDLPFLGELVKAWTEDLPEEIVISVDAAALDFGTRSMAARLWEEMEARLSQPTDAAEERQSPRTLNSESGSTHE